MEACKACIPELGKTPPQYALIYDKGISKFRVFLPHLNQVITPCFLRHTKSNRFSVEEGIRNRGVACCRVVVEIPHKNIKAWRFLSGIVPREDFYLLNDVWWWAVGFHNFKHGVIKPPAGL